MAVTQRERQLEELLSALVGLLDQMRTCPRCNFVPGPSECCRKLHALPYEKLRMRIKRELGRRPN